MREILQLSFEQNIATLSKILSIIERKKRIAGKKNRREKKQNRLVLIYNNYVILCGILSAGQMIFHAHIQSAVLMQLYNLDFGCGSTSFFAC